MSPYARMAEAIRAAIREGSLKPGEQLPGNRDLAEKHGVSLVTAQKALKVLAEQRWVTPVPSVGVFVNEKPDESDATTPEALARQLAELRAAVEALSERVGRIDGSAAS